MKGRIQEGDDVLSALHDRSIEDEHVQIQKRQILEAIEVESAQVPFKLSSLIWDDTGMSHHFLCDLRVVGHSDHR